MIGSEQETVFRNLIRDRLAALDEEDRTAEGNRATVVLDQQSVGRLSRMDALQQQAMAQATFNRRAGERQQLLAALKRLEDGTFGECLDCGDAIDTRRLQLAPTVLRCISCTRG